VLFQSSSPLSDSCSKSSASLFTTPLNTPTSTSSTTSRSSFSPLFSWFTFGSSQVLQGDEELARLSWNYLNDSMRLDLCLRYPARVIACSALFMAAERAQFSLPTSLGDGESSWWSVFDSSLEDILLIKSRIQSLYLRQKVLLSLLPFSLLTLPCRSLG
jgi:hypothetical protein